MPFNFYKNKWILLLSMLTLLSSCASSGNSVDPYETFNRHAYNFNQGLDKALLKPAAIVYKTIVPWPITLGISNFFSNLGEIPTIINDALQGKIYYFTSDVWRFLINSTIGIGGLFDVASKCNLPPHEEDFGLTLATWGYKSSNFLVLPFLGPTTFRDITNYPLNASLFTIYPYIDNVALRNGMFVVSILDRRSQLLDFDKLMRQAAFDPYIFERNAYLQRRAYLIEQNEKPPVIARLTPSSS